MGPAKHPFNTGEEQSPTHVMAPADATVEVNDTNKGVDWIGIVVSVGLPAVAVIALYHGDNVVAGTAVGAIAGYMNRLSS